MHDVPILPIGHAVPVCELGFIVNPCRNERVVSPWREAVNLLSTLCQTSLGASLQSLYLRGSVPRGTAVEYHSDLDAVCVTRSLPPLPPSLPAAIQARVREAHPFCTGVDLRIITHDRLLSPGRSAALQFLLKTQSLCIAGEAITENWPSFALQQARITLQGLRTSLAGTRASLTRQPGIGADERQQLCRWIAKKIVRAGFELVAERERAYTRDLYPCWTGFARHYPEMAEPMREVLTLAINPSPDPLRIEAALKVGDWLRIESRQRGSATDQS
jgi:hypothetical protein